MDDRGSPDWALAAYQALVAAGVEILLGPYGSGTVRRVAPLVCGSGRLLWNHGGAADDLASPLLATVVAPASTYLGSLLLLARDAGLEDVLVAPGVGRFASHVADGACGASETLGLSARRLDAGQRGALLEATTLGRATSLAGAAVVFAGTFEEDVAAARRVRGRGSRSGCWAVWRPASTSSAAGWVGWRTGSWPRRSGAATIARLRSDRPAQSSCAVSSARFGRAPDYLSAQAAAAGCLATEAVERGYRPDDVRGWHTDTLLGPFRLDSSWRRTGYSPVAVQWRHGRRWWPPSRHGSADQPRLALVRCPGRASDRSRQAPPPQPGSPGW
jgi:hypothetical protein